MDVQVSEAMLPAQALRLWQELDGDPVIVADGFWQAQAADFQRLRGEARRNLARARRLSTKALFAR